MKTYKFDVTLKRVSKVTDGQTDALFCLPMR